MTRDQLTYGGGGLLIGGIIVWAVMGMGLTLPRPQVVSQRGSAQEQVQSGEMMDAHFIEQMIPHHEDAITMANLALTKAQQPEIKRLSQAIIDSQSREIEQMKVWYAQWFGQALTTGAAVMRHHGMMGGQGMHMGMMGDETDIARLEGAADFDKVFIEEMIPHHQMAVMMASMLKAGTQRPEMRQLADDIIAAQTQEIDDMRAWYDAWY